MSDSESNESIQPRRLDDESGHLRQTGSDIESGKQPYATTHATSVKHSKTSVTCIMGGIIEFATSSGSAHNQGNQGWHVTPEEARSFKGGNYLETPTFTFTLSLRNTPPSLTPQRSWAMGRGRGRTRVEETKISIVLRIHKLDVKNKASVFRKSIQFASSDFLYKYFFSHSNQHFYI